MAISAPVKWTQLDGVAGRTGHYLGPARGRLGKKKAEKDEPEKVSLLQLLAEFA